MVLNYILRTITTRFSRTILRYVRLLLLQLFRLLSVLCLSVYLLPIKRDLNTVNRLRHAKTFELSQTRTERFRRSFMPYSLTTYE